MELKLSIPEAIISASARFPLHQNGIETKYGSSSSNSARSFPCIRMELKLRMYIYRVYGKRPFPCIRMELKLDCCSVLILPCKLSLASEWN